MPREDEDMKGKKVLSTMSPQDGVVKVKNVTVVMVAVAKLSIVSTADPTLKEKIMLICLISAVVHSCG